MRVSDFDKLGKEERGRRKDVDDWMTVVRQCQTDAARELYASYKFLVCEKASPKKNKVELRLFPSPTIVLGTREEALIYLRPRDYVVCYGPYQRPWDHTDSRFLSYAVDARGYNARNDSRNLPVSQHGGLCDAV